MMNNIQDKIRKLMAVVNGSSENGEAERETAMNMVQKLLVKYRIDMADVVLEGNDCPDVTSTTFHFHNAPWIRTIMAAMAKMNFCRYYWGKDYVKGAGFGYHTIVGLPHEIDATIELIKVLVHSCESEAKKGAKLHKEDKSFKRSFLNAASNRIYWRAVELVTEVVEHEINTGTALIVKNAYEVAEQRNDDFINEKVGELETAKSRSKSKSVTGFNLGKKYGSSVSLNTSTKIA